MHGLTDDADIRAAMDKARATSPQFLGALQKPAANQKRVVIELKSPGPGRDR